MTYLGEDKLHDGVVNPWDVHRCSCINTNNTPPLRILVEKDGVLYCSCKKDVNRGRPDKHIQCVLGGAFSEKQFHPHCKIQQMSTKQILYPCWKRMWQRNIVYLMLT